MIQPILVSIAGSAGAWIVMDFAKRLTQACDESPIVPEHGRGRQVYLAKKLKVTQEAVRKWLVGERMSLQSLCTKQHSMNLHDNAVSHHVRGIAAWTAAGSS